MDKQAWIEKAKAEGLEEFEIYEQKTLSKSISLYDGKVDGYTNSEVDGISVRGIYQGHVGSCFLEKMDDDALDYALKQIKTQAVLMTSEDEVDFYAGDEHYPMVEEKQNLMLDYTSEVKIELLKRVVDKIMAQDERIVEVMHCQYAENMSTRSIVNSKGLNLEDAASYSLLVAGPLAKDGDDVRNAFTIEIFHSLEEFDLDAFAQKAAKKALDQLHATSIPSNDYKVIMHHEALTSLVGSLTSLFNGDNANKGISILKDRLNQKIFDEKVTIIDDPLRKDGYSSCAFDDEGVATKTKTIVDHGVLTSFLHNLKSAKAADTVSTGNGFKHGYAGAVSIAPTNFYIQAGETSYEELIKQMDTGVIITNITGLHAGLNTTSTEFSLQSSGFYVEHGEIVKPISLITTAGSFMEMMNEIEAIGSDLEFSYNGIGTPSILFKKLSISGL